MKKSKHTNTIFSIFSIMLFCILTCMLLGVVIAAPAGVTDTNVQVTMVNQEPDPVEAGSYVTVRFKIVNYGSLNTPEMVAGIVEDFPFKVVSGESNEVDLGSLTARQTDDKAQIVEWKLLVNKDAAEGKNNITFYLKQKGSASQTIFYDDHFDVNVRTSDTVLTIQNITVSPENVEPGSDAIVKIRLLNIADSFIKDVRVTLDLSNIDIATIGTGAQQIVPKIDSKSSVDMTFKIRPQANVDVSVHKIPIKIEYKDNLNNVNTLNTSFGLVVNSPVKYLIYLDDTEIVKKGQSGEVTIKISNNGVNNIKFLTAELKQSPDYDIISTPKVYIGKIDSDDYETVTFKINAKGSDSGDNKLKLRLLLNYNDNYNKDYASEEEVLVPLYSDTDAQKYGLAKKSSNIGVVILIIIIIAVLGFYLYRRNKKKQKKDAA